MQDTATVLPGEARLTELKRKQKNLEENVEKTGSEKAKENLAKVNEMIAAIEASRPPQEVVPPDTRGPVQTPVVQDVQEQAGVTGGVPKTSTPKNPVRPAPAKPVVETSSSKIEPGAIVHHKYMPEKRVRVTEIKGDRILGVDVDTNAEVEMDMGSAVAEAPAAKVKGEASRKVSAKPKATQKEAVGETRGAMFSRKPEKSTSKGADVELGAITEDIAAKINRVPGKIRLQKGSDIGRIRFGIEHIERTHGEEIAQTGMTVPEFVSDVVAGFTEIRKGKGRSLFLVKRNGGSRVAVIELVPGGGEDFYTVTTAWRPRSEYINKKKLLWERSEPAQQDTQLAPPSATRRQDGLGDDDPNASGQSVSEQKIITPSEKSKPSGSQPTPDADADTIMFSRRGEQGRVKLADKLVAAHNLSAENILFAESMGGKIPVPSIGITKASKPFEGFGGITLLGNKELADPEVQPVFSADAYSARFPRPIWPKVKTKAAQLFMDRHQDAFQKLDNYVVLSEVWDNMVNSPDRDKAIELFLFSEGGKLAYLESQGKKFKVPMREKPLELAWSSDPGAIKAAARVAETIYKGSWSNFDGSEAHKELSASALNAVRAQAENIAKRKVGDRREVDYWVKTLGWGGALDGELIPFGTANKLLRDIENIGKSEVDRSEVQ